jgi:hypothetical protein
MVYLGGPGRGVRRPRLHDAPPGYRPPQISREEQRRQLRQDFILLRVATVCAVVLVTALVVIFLIIIATHL